MDSEVLSALDLPNLRSEPSFQILLNTLENLEVKPSSWNASATETTEDTAGLSRYLTSILKTPFDWFQDIDGEGLEAGDQKEMLWNLASKRLTERCGRSAMGEMSRKWVIPASIDHPELEIEIREPPLTGDNLGFKTWGTAWAIAQKLDDFGKQYLQHLLPNLPVPATSDIKFAQARVLELGAGTGLLGLAAAGIWGTDIVLTDLPLFQDNLLFNIQKNAAILNSRGANVSPDVLDWRDPSSGLSHSSEKKFEIVIVSDPLYDDSHPDLVASMIKLHLKLGKSSRAMVAVPMRDEKTSGFATKLRSTMEDLKLVLLHEGTEICRDDWANNGEEVRCWWGIWGHRLSDASD